MIEIVLQDILKVLKDIEQELRYPKYIMVPQQQQLMPYYNPQYNELFKPISMPDPNKQLCAAPSYQASN